MQVACFYPHQNLSLTPSSLFPGKSKGLHVHEHPSSWHSLNMAKHPIILSMSSRWKVKFKNHWTTGAWLPIGIIKGGKTMEVACMCLLCILSTLTQSCLSSSNNNNCPNQTQIQLSLSLCCMCGPFCLSSSSVYWKSKENIAWVLSEVGDPTKLATSTSWLTSWLLAWENLGTHMHECQVESYCQGWVSLSSLWFPFLNLESSHTLTATVIIVHKIK